MSNSSRERNQFADRYSQMSDEELIKLALESSDLSDTAWEALEAELEHRNLEIPEPEVEHVGSTELRNLVLLRRFRDIPEALLAKGRLEASGIECFLADENMVRMDWFISNLLGGVKLFVEPSDFSRASGLLNETSEDEIDLDNNEL
jgi:Putative prokaryotic signal transducing protein